MAAATHADRRRSVAGRPPAGPVGCKPPKRAGSRRSRSPGSMAPTADTKRAADDEGWNEPASTRNRDFRRRMERVEGIEPSYSAWKAAALPLSYTRPRRRYAVLCRGWQAGPGRLARTVRRSPLRAERDAQSPIRRRSRQRHDRAEPGWPGHDSAGAPFSELTGRGALTIRRTATRRPGGTSRPRPVQPLRSTESGVGECPERQRGRTVNPLAKPS
jgi:hypothetical protein